MVHLPDPGLDRNAAKHLEQYQRDVDGEPDYETRVAAAKRLFKRRNTRRNPAFRKVRESLTLMCSGASRCVYCEDSVGDEVEHIAPEDLYPGVVFAWGNYVYARGQCNGRKSNKFAVIRGNGLIDVTRRRGAPVVPPAEGPPAFLNPRVDEPLDFFHLDFGTFWLVARDDVTDVGRERARFTIRTLNLNRDVLAQARETAYAAYEALLFRYVHAGDSLPTSERTALADSLLSMPHPTVWAEMKRQHSSVPALDDLFSQAPQALMW